LLPFFMLLFKGELYIKNCLK